MSSSLEGLVSIRTQGKNKLLEKAVERKDFRVLITYPNYTKMLTPSYAVGLFTAILKEQGCNVDLFDCTSYMTSYNPQELPNPAVLANRLLVNKPFDPSFFSDVKTDLFGDFAKKLDDFKPHAVIFSTVVEDTWPQTRDLLEVLSHYPEIKSIVGGTFTTMLSRYPDHEHKVIANPYVQCVGEGEGEDTIVDFCEAVRQGLPTNRVPGTRAKDENGSIIHNPPRSLVDINKTPIPDFSLFDKKRFERPLGAKSWRAIPIETFRGCPYTCRFCNSPAQVEITKERLGVDFRRRKNMDVLRKEITTLLEQNDGNFLYINDDAFMARPMSEIDAFIEMYSNIRVPFWMQTRFEDIRSEEQLARLKEVGLYRISFGLEHGNEQFRREKMDRHITNENMIEKAQIVARVGVPYSVNVIIGNPYETRKLVFDTINLNRELGGFDSVAPNIFTPYHGTKMRDDAVREGWLDQELQTNSFVGGSILRMPPPYLQEDEMLRLQRVYNLYVNLPRDRWSEIERAEKLLGTDEGEALWEELKKEFYQLKYGTSEFERKPTYAG